MEENKQSSKLVKVLMLPWLAHGHTSPFLELAKRLATRNFHIYICSTPVLLNSIKKKVTEKFSSSIELVELHLPSSSELPPHYHTTNGLPPHLMITLKKAYEMSVPQFTDILTSLQPDLLVYDFIQYWAAEIALSKSIPAVHFMTFGASIISFGLHFMKNPGKEFPYPELYIRDYEWNKMKGQHEVEYNNSLSDRDRFLRAVELSQKILLVKSSPEIDGKYFDLLSEITNKKAVPVGHLVQEPTPEDDRDEDEEIVSWLDHKEKGSVLYVSFGSEYFLTKEERDVVSRALELSNVNFIWVIRFPQGEQIRIQEALPEGFLDRVGNRGKLVEGWAPQAKILKHPSTGAFVSHCGWSSVMESMVWGVPIIAMPMHIDQPLNARVVEAVGVGVEPVRDENGNLQSEEIARVIRKVMVDESGEDVRKKSKELSETLERKGDEEIDALTDELLGLIQKK